MKRWSAAVIRYNDVRGFGFVRIGELHRDACFNYPALQKAGVASVREGDRFRVVVEPRGDDRLWVRSMERA